MDHDKVVVELKECLDHMKDMRTVLVGAIDCINRLYASLSFEHNRNNDLEQEVSRLKKLLDESSEESDGGKCEPVEEIVEEPDPICVGDECVALAANCKELGRVIVASIHDDLYTCIFTESFIDCIDIGTFRTFEHDRLWKTGRKIEYQYV